MNSERNPIDRELFEQLVGAEHVRANEPMSAHTTFKVGGPADLYVEPQTMAQLIHVIRACREDDAPYFVLGLGSDLLVGDGGFRGVMVACPAGLDDIEVSGTRIICQPGAAIADVSRAAEEHGLTGLEFACGIPGSVGGAVFMNAGAYDGCIADVLASATLLGQEGDVFDLPVEDLDLGYRTSRVRAQGLVVLSATFALTPGDKWDICAKMADLTERRQAKQPLELPSAGSTFKRPEGHYAGKLITDAGLKGYRSGGAAVSTKHAGFVVNLGGATAADVRAVIAHVQDEVQRQFGVHLEPEVRFIGEF
ncbi:UDP-N-acetylmuramate dehydrogenase [uncultured Parolsenella sp.]|uniref:UDP-N-acetylmuramate dehydrogenase n=1 Tax=uncultured Parolsenella sp. TaxID=2083008 RepID=UPI0027DB5C86|nr:UDP-N-acetylmuramate dehydrogenase [uncultured Parolsenella sp.]